VETCAQFEALTALNCDFAQGYFMAKPMPAEQIVLNAVVEPCAEQGTPGGIPQEKAVACAGRQRPLGKPAAGLNQCL
jgi:predicted signal transduction protein with EAL and GGDEF domain